MKHPARLRLRPIEHLSFEGSELRTGFVNKGFRNLRILGLVILLATLAGCANRYKITLQNGNTMTTSSRPKLNEDKSAFEFKDGRGTRTTIPVFRVKEIAPL